MPALILSEGLSLCSQDLTREKTFSKMKLIPAAFLAVSYSAPVQNQRAQFGEGLQVPSNAEHLREPIAVFIEEYIQVNFKVISRVWTESFFIGETWVRMVERLSLWSGKLRFSEESSSGPHSIFS